MPTERIAMRRGGEMLRLSRDAGLATREVARRTGVALSTLREMFRRFEMSGLTWPLPLDLADAELEARLYGEAGTKQSHRRWVRLGGAEPRVEAQAGHPANPVGGVYRGQPGRLLLQPVIVDPRTGRTRGAHIFVAVMGGPSLSFAHASWTETLPDWIDAHARTFAISAGRPGSWCR